MHDKFVYHLAEALALIERVEQDEAQTIAQITSQRQARAGYIRDLMGALEKFGG